MNLYHSRSICLVLTLIVFCSTGADWKRFRGPGASGQSAETGLPVEWDTAGKNVLWKKELPGPGASSPIVVDGRVYVTCYSGYGLDQQSPGERDALRRHLVAFNLADGQQVVDASEEVTQPVYDFKGFQALHGYASSTLASDGKQLFGFFGAGGVKSGTLSGDLLWTTDVGDKTNSWGSASSPVLFENLVIVNAFVQCGKLVALDKNTGDIVWRKEGIKSSWSSPVIVRTPDGKSELVINSKGEILAYDPATGDPLWRCQGIPDYVCPTVIAHDGVVYAIGGRKRTTVAVKAGGRGDVTKTHRLWEARKGSNVSSPVYHDGHLYFFHESAGVAYCLDAETGEVKFEERLDPRPDRIYASPVAADGRIYLVTRNEGAFVLAAKPEFELIAHNEPLDESVFNGSPAIVDKKILLRSDRYLYCLEKE